MVYGIVVYVPQHTIKYAAAGEYKQYDGITYYHLQKKADDFIVGQLGVYPSPPPFCENPPFGM